MSSKRPILVTGAPRSGTTWVGRTLAEERSVRYIHEPFNISGPQCHCGLSLRYWFYYATPEDGALLRHLEHLLCSPIHPTNLLNTATALLSRHTELPRHVQGAKALKYIVASPRARHPLVKDPLSIFSAEWLATQFDMAVLVLIRHPAGFVSSYKKLGWTHPFSHFLQQPALLRDCLPSFIDEIELYAREEQDLIDQASLLWRLINSQIYRYQAAHPDWIFVRYTDLVRDPVSGFADIFQRLGLPFSKSVQSKIVRQMGSFNVSQSSDANAIKHGSGSNIERWKQRLTAAEITRIKHSVEDVSSLFFRDDEW